MTIKDKFPTRSPSLVLDFINTDQLDPRITFGRNDATSCATYFDSNGILRIADANVPRLDHDPVTLKRKGLFIEEARTNLKTYSENIASGFTQQNTTVTTDAAMAPDGAMTADLAVPNTVSASHASFKIDIAFATSTAYTYSIFAKPSGYSTLQLTFTSAFNNIDVWANFILVGTGSIGFKGTGATASIQQCANGWYRCILTGTSGAAATTGGCAVIVLDSDRNARDPAFSGNDTSGAYIWGAQLEKDAFATSYIPTDASTVTRAVDVAQINAVSPWYNQLEGTWYTSAIVPNSANTGAQRRIHVGAHNLATPTDDFYQVGRNTGTGIRYVSRVGDVAQIGVNGITNNPVYDDSGYAKIAIGYKADNYAATGDGRAPTKFTSTALVPTVDYIILGNTSSYSDLFCLNGHLQRIAYYTILLNDAELQELTTTP